MAGADKGRGCPVPFCSTGMDTFGGGWMRQQPSGTYFSTLGLLDWHLLQSS